MSASDPSQGAASPADAGQVALLPALSRILERIPSAEDRARFDSIFRAAAVAIEALGELDLERWERMEIGTADLSAWEELAPLISSTLGDVNTLLATVRSALPVEETEPTPDVDAAFDDLFGEPSEPPANPPPPTPGPPNVTPGPEARARDAVTVIRGIADALGREITAFGQGLRKPAVMADRWNMLAHLAEFRGKFRAGIGELVFLAATSFLDTRKEEVVPFYREEVDQAVELRRTFAELAEALRLDNEKLQAAANDQVPALAQGVIRRLESFVASASWKLVRPCDKRSFVAARQELPRLLAEGSPREVKRAIEGLDKFLDSLSIINRRETLVTHDRATLATLAGEVREAEAAATAKNESLLRTRLEALLRTAGRLHGRDRAFDAVLRSMKGFSVANLPLHVLRDILAGIAPTIAAIPAP